ncbi:hypothetical protein Ancab_004514 [Ancistrocladus abbreviatus]
MADGHPVDVIALQDLWAYKAQERPLRLKGWELTGEESREAIRCTGSSILRIELHGPVLGSYLRDLLLNFHSLKDLDFSSNNIRGEIPFGSPPKVTNVNPSHTLLPGTIGNDFEGLQILKVMAIQDNNFSAVILEHFHFIPNLWIRSNKFHGAAKYSSWDSPFDNVPKEQNIADLLTSKSNASEISVSKVGRHKRKGLSEEPIFIVGGVALATTFAALLVSVCTKQACKKMESIKGRHSSMYSLLASSTRDYCSGATGEMLHMLDIDSPPKTQRHRPPGHHVTKSRTSQRSFSRKFKMPSSAKLYPITDVQLAMCNDIEPHFHGEGLQSSAYKVEYPNGQMFAVKNINAVSLLLREEEHVMSAIRDASHLRHPNIVRRTNHCVKHGQHRLLHEHIWNLPLDGALCCEYFVRLTWGLCLLIAVRVTQTIQLAILGSLTSHGFKLKGHFMKDQSTGWTQNYLQTPCRNHIIISGTPIQNGFKEFWAPFDFCCPDLFGDKKELKDGYKYPILHGDEKKASNEKKHIDSNVVEANSNDSNDQPPARSLPLGQGGTNLPSSQGGGNEEDRGQGSGGEGNGGTHIPIYDENFLVLAMMPMDGVDGYWSFARRVKDFYTGHQRDYIPNYRRHKSIHIKEWLWPHAGGLGHFPEGCPSKEDVLKVGLPGGKESRLFRYPIKDLTTFFRALRFEWAGWEEEEPELEIEYTNIWPRYKIFYLIEDLSVVDPYFEIDDEVHEEGKDIDKDEQGSEEEEQTETDEEGSDKQTDRNRRKFQKFFKSLKAILVCRRV